MNTEVSIIISPEHENNQNLIKRNICRELEKKNIFTNAEKIKISFVKKSIDARHGKVKYILRYKVFDNEKEYEEEKKFTPRWKNADGHKTVLIAGSGPAGLFAALTLLEEGIKPVIIERGKNTSDRKKDIACISTKNIVGSDSNYCFGEGGAGTFSDGKLFSRSNKRGNISNILETFVFFGADKKILTDAHPHIGTDKLPSIINAMRKKIIELGGEFYFDTKLTSFITENNCVKGIETTDTISGQKKFFFGQAIILATGHSANDIYYLMAKTAPSSLEAKTFAVGVRIEHPRTLINAIQYHGREKFSELPAAEYRLTSQICDKNENNARGVYSFCMCPGGFVVPSASDKNQIVVNGMSAAKRNSQWSNAAIVVETRPEDIPQEFVKEAQEINCPEIAGLLWRTALEEETYKHGKGQAAPAQRVTDFIAGRESKSLPVSSYTPGLVASRLDLWLPEQICVRLKKAFIEFNKNMKGFVCDEGLLIASETRTSTPVRILRDKETFESPALKNLYPAGEGSGYSGGITSSALDGQNVARKIIERLK
jgi:uncharacterized protein